MKDLQIIKTQIEEELGQKITNIKDNSEWLMFDCEDGIRRTNKLTKARNHKKNSIRVW